MQRKYWNGSTTRRLFNVLDDKAWNKQNTSSAMSNEGGGGGRRQSIVSSVGKLSKPASRRPSVTV